MLKTETQTQHRINAILKKWGSGTTGLPSKDVWNALARCANDQPITLVNFFKMREYASYPTGSAKRDDHLSGDEAFQRYAAVSMPSLEQVGGKFLMVAPFGHTFIGDTEDWDVVAIGSYPNPAALLSLFEIDAYHEAYVHRIAACSNQHVSLCLG